ncbi:MAG: hypothetical protein RLZZ214_3639, partial [Verrucomicrobiota bacterium]
PLTWSGRLTPSIPSTGLPNLRFTSYNNLSPVRPSTTGSFAGGVWSGLVSVPFTAPGVELLADDGDGHIGTSNDFAVKTATPVSGSGTIYSENFETVPLASSWTFTGTNDYRTQVTTSNTPHGGTRHLTMDSSGYGFSRNEATWTVDLAGIRNVTLKFWAKEFADLPDGPPSSPFIDGANFDGVAISVDGTKWYEVQALRSLTSTWTQYTVNLDTAIASLGLAYNSAFKIRFNQYGDDSIPYNGIAVDDIEIVSTPSAYALRVTGPAQVSEGAAAAQFTVTLPFISPADAVISLNSSAPAKLAVPAQVTVPAGRSIGYFSAQPLEDSLADGRKTVAISASSTVFPTGSLSFLFIDNDQPVATFTVPTKNTVEGAGTIQGTVAVSTPAAAPLVFNVTSTNATAVTVPATITIPVGATSVALPLGIVNDTKVDGTQSANIAVSLLGSGLSQNLTITVADNETLDLRLQPTASPAPTTVNEGAGTMTFTANLPGTVTTSTTLTFSSSAPSKITAPAAAVITAGGTTASVTFTILDDLISQPPAAVTLTVSAPGFTSGSCVLTVLDNDPHHFTISPVASPQVRGASIPITATACDAAGATLSGFTGSATLAANGVSIQPVSLSGFVAGVWSGTARVNDAGSNVVLTVSDTQGHTGSSNPFDVGAGAFQQLTWAPVGSTQTPGSNIAATVQATDAGGHTDSSVNGPITLRALTPVPTIAIGTGSDDTTSLLYTYYARARSEVIYLAGEIGGPRTLGGISFKVASGAVGQVLSNLTVRLKTTPRTSLDSSAGWDGGGWTVVHQSNQTLSSNGWMTFLFDVAFEYNGSENLLADFSFNSATAPGSSAYWAADYSSSASRVLYGYSSTVTDPLTWSGTGNSAYTTYYLPQTRLLTLQPVPANIPASPALSAGTWSGAISFAGNLDRVFLDAADSAGHRGRSNGFRVGTAAPVAVLPFSDGFESGGFADVWTISTTAEGRVRVLSTNSPHTGAQHAVLDSANTYARTEMTLPLDLTGYSGVTLGFWAKRFGGTDDGPPTAPFTGSANFDGVAMSADGT